MRFSVPHNPRCLAARGQSSVLRLPTAAFTVIEMLIVVSITVLLVAAAVTRMRPALESRRTREAARALYIYLGSARNRAMETGRPCGVMLRCFRNSAGTLVTPPMVMMADQCEVPPCYCGDTEASTASVTYNGTQVVATLKPASDDPKNMLTLVTPSSSTAKGQALASCPQLPLMASRALCALYRPLVTGCSPAACPPD